MTPRSPGVQLWAHPVSFAEDAAAAATQIAGAGVDRVRLAYAYHSGRWLRTTSRPGVAAHLPAGLWFAPDTGYPSQLPPRVAAPGAAETGAAQALRAAGLGITAWLVGLHSSRLAAKAPELALCDAFGTRSAHALCPAQETVAEYARHLAVDAARQPGVSGLDLEAFGYLGWPHQGPHEKSGVALRPVDVWLLSLCFCPACETRMAGAGLDPQELRQRVRAALRGQVTAPVTTSGKLSTEAQTILGADTHAALQQVRTQVVAELVRTVVKGVSAAASHVRVQIRATADPYSCAGKTAGALPEIAAAGADITVTDFRGDRRALGSEVVAARAAGKATVTAGWSLFHTATASPDALSDAVTTAMEAGADDLAFYCFDLIAAERLGWLTRVGSEARRRAA